MKTYILDVTGCPGDLLEKTWIGSKPPREIPCEQCELEHWEFYVHTASIIDITMDRWRQRSGQTTKELKLGFDFTNLPDGAVMRIVEPRVTPNKPTKRAELHYRIDALQSAINLLQEEMRTGLFSKPALYL